MNLEKACLVTKWYILVRVIIISHIVMFFNTTAHQCLNGKC